MTFRLAIEFNTATLGGDSLSRNQEFANILIALAADLLDQGLAPGDTLPLRDRYGNSVGTAQLTDHPVRIVAGALGKHDAGAGADRLRRTGGNVRPLRGEL